MEINQITNKNISNNTVKKNLESEINTDEEKKLYHLSDKNNISNSNNISTLRYNNNDLTNNISIKKKIKVNIGINSRTKKNISPQKNIKDSKNQKEKFEDINIKEDENISIAQRITKFESRIDNLLNIINDFETKFIKSPETQRIKEKFSDIINKKIYKNKILNDTLYKSWIKTDYNNNFFKDNENNSISKNSYIMDIKNINININNNKYENNFFLTQSSQNKLNRHRPFIRKQKSSEKKFKIKTYNNSIFKKSILKSIRKKPKCISNDTKKLIITNYTDDSKLSKLSLENLLNKSKSKNIRRNFRNNNSFKDLYKPLTERKQNYINDKILIPNKLKNKMKIENKKIHSCLRISKAIKDKEEKGIKPLFKKYEIKNDNLIKDKKNLFGINITTATLQTNHLKNFSIKLAKNNKNKEKNLINYSNLYKNKENSKNYINNSLNKTKILKRNNIITFFTNNKNNIDADNDKIFINKNLLYNKGK